MLCAYQLHSYGLTEFFVIKEQENSKAKLNSFVNIRSST